MSKKPYEPTSLRSSSGLESGAASGNRFATVSYGQRAGAAAAAENGNGGGVPERIGRFLPGLDQTLGQPRGPFGIRKKIGNDDRQHVAGAGSPPYSGILMLSYRTANGAGPMQATAWLVGPQVAITAGHVVWDRARGNNWSSQMRAYQGVNGSPSGVPSATVTGMNTTVGWQTSGQADCDFAVIYLDSAFSGHHFQFSEFSESDLEMMNVNVVGYPVDKPNKLMQHAGQIFDARETLLYYQMDTEGGQSGCPLIYWSTTGDYRVVGIHSGAAAGPYNQGVRIADGIFDTLQSWI